MGATARITGSKYVFDSTYRRANEREVMKSERGSYSVPPWFAKNCKNTSSKQLLENDKIDHWVRGLSENSIFDVSSLTWYSLNRQEMTEPVVDLERPT